MEVDTYLGTTTFTVKNTGIAPVYKDLYVYLGGAQSKQSLKYLQNGETMSVVVDAIPMQDTTIEKEVSIYSDWCLNGETVPFNADLTVSAKLEL